MLNGVPPFSPPPTTQELQSTTFGNCSGGVKKNKKQKWASSWELANEGDQHQQAGRSMHMHVAPGGIIRITVTCTARSLCLSLSHTHTALLLTFLFYLLPFLLSLHSFLSLLALLIICLTSSSNIQVNIHSSAHTETEQKVFG